MPGNRAFLFINFNRLESTNGMVTIEKFKALALSFPDAVELPHFDKTSFRVNKKIFATFYIHKKLACVSLSEIDQSIFTAYDSSLIYPVPNKWGTKGATFIELDKVRLDLLKDALDLSYQKLKPKPKLKKTNKK